VCATEWCRNKSDTRNQLEGLQISRISTRETVADCSGYDQTAHAVANQFNFPSPALHDVHQIRPEMLAELLKSLRLGANSEP
jgi:hypothetical protein